MVKNPLQLNVLSLAYMGDAVWEQYVRAQVIEMLPDANHADYLHKEGVKYVNANAQAFAVKTLIDDGLLSEDEVALIKRARNHKTATKAKNADAITYKWATAFEAYLGFLFLSEDTNRLNEIMEKSAAIIREKGKGKND
ncbi:MAG: ribonuclease III [Clostridia bacterium]|nr:ribonuclease III [Clostridia bacterium]